MLFVGCTAKENAETTTATNGNDTSSVTENVGMQQPELPQKHTISLTMNNQHRKKLNLLQMGVFLMPIMRMSFLK